MSLLRKKDSVEVLSIVTHFSGLPKKNRRCASEKRKRKEEE
jgi:hypothetical protein